jgi:hypothetical protein
MYKYDEKASDLAWMSLAKWLVGTRLNFKEIGCKDGKWVVIARGLIPLRVLMNR